MSANSIDVVIRKLRIPKEGRHGAVWKIAYADFMTAMMAFFLLLWLLSSSSTETIEGVGNVFEPTTEEEATAAGGGLFGGPGKQQEDPIQVQSNPNYKDVDAVQNSPFPYKSEFTGVADEFSTGSSGSLHYDVQIDRNTQNADRLRNQIAGLPDGDLLEQTVTFNIAPEGVHVELIVPQNKPMFEIGSAILTQEFRVLLRPVVLLLASREEQISIGGYADSSGMSDVANFALSADRAIAARDFLISSGFPSKRVENVEAYGDRRPQIDYDPVAPGNRRLTITLLDADYMRIQEALLRDTIPPLLLKQGG